MALLRAGLDEAEALELMKKTRYSEMVPSWPDRGGTGQRRFRAAVKRASLDIYPEIKERGRSVRYEQPSLFPNSSEAHASSERPAQR